MKTQEEMREMWLKALESGKYDQGYNVLHDTGDNFCCLGVACDLFAEDFGLELRKFGGDNYYSYGGRSHFLPDKILNAMGFKTDVGTFDKEFQYEHNGETIDSLAKMNDEGDMNFVDIAKFVRKNMSAVFKD